MTDKRKPTCTKDCIPEHDAHCDACIHGWTSAPLDAATLRALRDEAQNALVGWAPVDNGWHWEAVAAWLQAHLDALPIPRCEITGNPVGTDTVMEGQPCGCNACAPRIPPDLAQALLLWQRAWVADRFMSGELDEALVSAIDDAVERGEL